MKVWCFDDAAGWGQGVFNAAKAAGHMPFMFDDPHMADSGVAFVHMHHHPLVRRAHKSFMQKLAVQRDVLMIPSLRASELYDDKLHQARHLAKWMPRTRVFSLPFMARTWLEANETYPFYSKSAEGTSSYNVRRIESFEDARLEIKFAFSDRGLKARYGQKQIGYLLWQEAIPNDGYEYRIFAVGRKRMVLKRTDKRQEPVNVINDEVAAYMRYADHFFEREGLHWGAVDVMRDKETGRLYILEYMVGWSMDSLSRCHFIDSETITNQTVEDIWTVLMQEIDAGRMGDFEARAA